MYLKEAMEERKISITRASKDLKVARSTLSRIINGHYSITADIAYRLACYFGTSIELWTNLQMQYDISEIQNNPNKVEILPYLRS